MAFLFPEELAISIITIKLMIPVPGLLKNVPVDMIFCLGRVCTCKLSRHDQLRCEF